METVSVTIRGMTCQGCVKSVTRVLSGLPGVTSVDVSLEKSHAVVSFDESLCSLSKLHFAIKGAGFEAV